MYVQLKDGHYWRDIERRNKVKNDTLYTGWYKDACEQREEETLENFNGSVSAVFGIHMMKL
jgi:hypothetical protein